MERSGKECSRAGRHRGREVWARLGPLRAGNRVAEGDRRGLRAHGHGLAEHLLLAAIHEPRAPFLRPIHGGRECIKAARAPALLPSRTVSTSPLRLTVRRSTWPMV